MHASPALLIVRWLETQVPQPPARFNAEWQRFLATD
jgi:hypothetical protein